MIRELKKRRRQLGAEVAMLQERRERAHRLGQEDLALRLLTMVSERYGAMAANAEQLRQARAVLGVPWRGKGC